MAVAVAVFVVVIVSTVVALVVVDVTVAVVTPTLCASCRPALVSIAGPATAGCFAATDPRLGGVVHTQTQETTAAAKVERSVRSDGWPLG